MGILSITAAEHASLIKVSIFINLLKFFKFQSPPSPHVYQNLYILLALSLTHLSFFHPVTLYSTELTRNSK